VEAAGSKQDRELLQPGHDERVNEEVDVVPKCGNDASGAEPPRVVAASQHNHGDIDHSLKRMKESDTWVKNCR
jgi:hypothetical protein